MGRQEEEETAFEYKGEDTNQNLVHPRPLSLSDDDISSPFLYLKEPPSYESVETGGSEQHDPVSYLLI